MVPRWPLRFSGNYLASRLNLVCCRHLMAVILQPVFRSQANGGSNDDHYTLGIAIPLVNLEI